MVDTPRSVNAHLLKENCGGGHIVRIALVTSRLTFLIWRLFVIMGTACIGVDRDSNGMRFRFRPPNDADLAQLRQAIETYIQGKRYDAHALSTLQGAFGRVPRAAQSFFVDLATLAEAYVILHEVGHELPLPWVRPMTLGDLKINPQRQAAWEDELKSDISACDLLLIGLMSAMVDPQKQAGKDSEAMRATRAHAFALIACAVEGVHAATWLAARADEPRGASVQMPARADPRYRTHPPVQIRHLVFQSWLARRTEETNTPDMRALSTVVGDWFHALAAQAFPDATAANAPLSGPRPGAGDGPEQ